MPGAGGFGWTGRSTSTRFPADYGLIAGTLAEDGNPWTPWSSSVSLPFRPPGRRLADGSVLEAG